MQDLGKKHYISVRDPIGTYDVGRGVGTYFIPKQALDPLENEPIFFSSSWECLPNQRSG